jgi:hypothetical protein
VSFISVLLARSEQAIRQSQLVLTATAETSQKKMQAPRVFGEDQKWWVTIAEEKAVFALS